MEPEEAEKLTDEDLKRLMEQLANEVGERQSEVQSLRTQVEGMQADIHRTQLERAEFAKQLHRAEEVSPLLEHCVQVKQALEDRQRLLEAVTMGTATQCSDVRQLSKVESGLELTEMEARNKENLASLAKVEVSYDEELKERQELDVKREELQRRVSKLREQQDQAPKHTRSMEVKLEKFLRKACKETGLQLPGAHEPGTK